jgi:hypothetical protein
LFNDLFYVLKEILNLAICCYNILVMEFLGCYRNGYPGLPIALEEPGSTIMFSLPSS